VELQKTIDEAVMSCKGLAIYTGISTRSVVEYDGFYDKSIAQLAEGQRELLYAIEELEIEN
jgi:hypothetical protein